jgi:L-asparaginase II
MLTTARFLGEETRGYIKREHPAQQRWFDALGDLAGVDMRQLPWSYDGCGIPVIAMPLRSIATAFARLAAPDDLAAGRAEAVDRIATAIAENPFMVAGSGRLCTEIMELTGRRVLVKTGADGVYTAALRDKSLGIALKIDDGTGEAAEVVLLAVLKHLDALHPDELETLAERCRRPITNTRGVITGQREPAELWL